MKEDVARLVVRLEGRGSRVRLDTTGFYTASDVLTDQEAASTIRALVAERDKWNDMHTRECEMRDRYRIKLAAAEAELREAEVVMRVIYNATAKTYPNLKKTAPMERVAAFLATMEKPHE